mgnify:CR=1 FL=1
MGNLGAGKTTFVKGVASHFGIFEDHVLSPTFVYMNLYDHLAHFDLYRLQGEEQFFSMGFDEYFTPPYIALVEWPGILKKALPEKSYWVTIEHCEKGREIEVTQRIETR